MLTVCLSLTTQLNGSIIIMVTLFTWEYGRRKVRKLHLITAKELLQEEVKVQHIVKLFPEVSDDIKCKASMHTFLQLN